MKKIQLSMLSAGMLALALSGCNNADPVIQQTLSTNGRVISFQPVTDKIQPSGALQKTASLTTDSLRQFNVWARTGNDFVTNLGVAGYGGAVEVTRVGGRWTYGPPLAEWPDAGNTVNFYAVSTIDGDVCPTEINMSDTSITYGIPPGDPYQRDLLVAVQTGVAAPAEGDNQVVSLKFQHALSRVRVQARNMNPADSIKIVNVKLYNLYYSCKLKLTSANVPAEQGFSYDPENPDPKWTTTNSIRANSYHSGTLSVLVPYTPASYVSVLGDSAGAGKTDNSLMVLPQLTNKGTSSTGSPPANISGGDQFYLYIQAHPVKGDGTPNGNPTDYYIAVPDPHPSRSTYGITFEPGREYTFQVTLNANRFIHFDGVQVNDWNKTAGTGSDGNIGVLPEP